MLIREKGHMSLTLFKLIIDIASQVPFINSVALYIWGRATSE